MTRTVDAGSKTVSSLRKIFCVYLLFFTGANICSAQIAGDYESNGTGGGTWNVAATWLTYNGSVYIAAVAPLRTAAIISSSRPAMPLRSPVLRR